MREIEQHVDTNSANFKQGVEAGLNSAEDTKNWQAGNELGQELKSEVANKEPVSESLVKEPLFMSESSEGKKGNPQDEKDQTEE